MASENIESRKEKVVKRDSRRRDVFDNVTVQFEGMSKRQVKTEERPIRMYGGSLQ